MALPFIILGVAAGAAAFGGKKAYDGYQKKSEAEDIFEKAKERYEEHKGKFEQAEAQTSSKLTTLGNKELEIGKDFSEFDRIAAELLARLEKEGNKDLKLSVPQHNIDKIHNLAISATEYLSTVVAAGVSGAAAGFAVYSGVMAFAAASTGTPIAALSGAAAYNATMAAIGGGSLAAGGMGMAGGAMVLGTAVAAPLIAIAGWAYDRHATKALENAHQCACKVERAVKKMNLAREHFAKVNQYVDEILAALNRMHAVFTEHYFEPLKSMHAVIAARHENNASAGADESEEIITLIEHGYLLAAIMTDIITTPLFKPRKQENGEAVIKDNVIEMEKDDNGMNVINKEELDDVLASSVVKFDDFSSRS
ncbi:chemotaxis protein [Escherichia coli]|uniref:chemotaxis protein n=1 Tax=Escherichia coli TaxID=562 RepID=UPI001C402E0A|nr:chemotaxis protein [Escherichia coli]